MSDSSLLMLAKEIRGKTFKILDGLSEDTARFAPPGLANSVLWHAGHAYIVNEALGVTHATGKPPVYPDGWFDKFSWTSKPATVTEWPKLADVVDRLKDQLTRLTAAIESIPAQDFDRVVDPARNRTLRYVILHGLHDEANHQGEMWLLKKLHSKRS